MIKNLKTDLMFLVIFLSIGLIITPYLLSEASAGVLVEFKKYKVINSPKVCGDKLCSEIDEQRSQKGLSTRDIKICGDRPCYDITSRKINSFNKSSPLGQYKLGIAIDLIECKENKVIIIKSTNQLPACVNAENVEKLRGKNWAVSEQVQLEIFEKLADDRKSGLITGKTLTDFDVGLSIIPDEIANQRYLVIDGFGWHRLHNVEITITSQDFNESIRSKTTDRGDLHTLWQIPDSVGGKMYNIFATDGIHEFELEIPIAINYLNTKSSDEIIAQVGKQVEKTKLRLNDITTSTFNGGMPIVFSGNLSTKSEFVPNAEILIVGDGPCPADGIISKGITDKFGRYYIFTETMIWDPSDNMIKIHAEYFGNEMYLPSSSQEEVIVVYPTKDTKSC